MAVPEINPNDAVTNFADRTQMLTLLKDVRDAVVLSLSGATSADTSLTTRVSTEESTRASADTSLTTRLSAEESARASVATSLTTRLSTEESTRASQIASINARWGGP